MEVHARIRMQIVTAHNGVLRTLASGRLRHGGAAAEAAAMMRAAIDGAEGSSASPAARTFQVGLPALDDLAPGRVFGLGVVHEVLFPPGAPTPRSFALLLAMSAARVRSGCVAWCDPDGTLYPPALARAGLPTDRLLILRPQSPADQVWAAAECLRSVGVAAMVLEPARLTRVQARRLQLAAETGGGAGVFVRPQRAANQYAAATRWLVRPEKGERAVQRWRVELVHGHGGRLNQPLILEVSREVVRIVDPTNPSAASAHPVRATVPMGDRPPPAERAAG